MCSSFRIIYLYAINSYTNATRTPVIETKQPNTISFIYTYPKPHVFSQTSCFFHHLSHIPFFTDIKATHHLSHTTFSLMDHPPPPLSIIPSPSHWKVLEEIDLWGYPVL